MSGMLSDHSFSEAASEWLEAQRPSVHPVSYHAYRDIVGRYILPRIGAMRTRDVTGGVVEELTAALSRREGAPALSGSTLNSVRGIASRIVEYAMERDDIAAPKATVYGREEFTALTADETRILCAAARSHPCRESLCVLLMLFAGIRMGEMCALSCDDISLTTGEMRIKRSVRRIRQDDGGKAKTALDISAIATKSHIRTEKIPRELTPLVRGFYRPGTFLLTGESRGIPEPRTFQNRAGRFFAESRINGVTFQRLRKTYAAGKADPLILAEIFSKRGGKARAGDAESRKELTGRMQAALPQLRESLGIGMDRLADMSGIAEARITGAEAGRVRLRWAEFLALMFIFRMNEKSRDVAERYGLMCDIMRENDTEAARGAKRS